MLESKLYLDESYKIAKEHKYTHRGCGGEPYLDYEYLYNFVKKISNLSTSLPKEVDTTVGSAGDFSILELGMGIGFTSLVMHAANPQVEIDTIETHGEHLEIAKKWFKQIAKDEGRENIGVNIIQADVHNILPFLETNKYDFIFFDVYGPKEKFIIDFERILKPNGILYSVNSHLKSAEQNYFDYLDNSDKWEKVDEFNDTKILKMLD